MHMIKYLGGLAEIVEDLDTAAAFYERLGLEVERTMPGYCEVKIDGVAHFGLWERRHAAESTFGSSDAADRIPLGFVVSFEVDDVDKAADAFADVVLRGAKDESWGQRTLRFTTSSGAIAEIAVSPKQ